MKKFFLSVILMMFLLQAVDAQVPQGIKYQAVARNAIGNILPNQAVNIRLSILQGSVNGSIIYTETHSKTTNAIGLFDLVIGQGTVMAGTFASINWKNGPYYLMVELDPSGGNMYQTLGTAQFMSVPYAFYSEESGSTMTAGNGINITNGIISNTLPDQAVTLNAGAGISVGGTYPNFNISNTAADQVINLVSGSGIQVSGSYPSFSISNTSQNETHTGDATGSAALSVIKIRGRDVSNTAPADGQVLKWNATSLAWEPKPDDNNGGTLNGTGSGTQLAYWNGPNTLSGNSNLFWDNTNFRLGLGTSTPGQQLEITQNFKLPLSGISAGNIYKGSNLFIHNYGTGNMFCGESAGNLNLTGTNNSGIGYMTLNSLSSGTNNSAFGSNALKNNNIGARNTSLGSNALLANITGNDITVAGYGADVNVDGLSNSTAIGSGATITASNQVVLGNSSITSLICKGVYASSTSVVPNVYVSSSGQVMRSTVSDLIHGGGSMNCLAFWTAPTGISSNANLLWDNTNERLGVGTGSPDSKLHVAGLIHSSSGGIKFPDNTIQTTASSGDGYSLNADDGNPLDAVYVNNAGNVGLNTTSAAWMMDIDGRSTTEADDAVIRLNAKWNPQLLMDIGSNSADAKIRFRYSGTDLWSIVYDGSADALDFRKQATTVLYLNSSQNVGIGTNAPNQQLELTGNFRLPPSTAAVGNIYKGPNIFLHNCGTANTFLGIYSGNQVLTGTNNAAAGFNSLHAISSGNCNTAFGSGALDQHTTGHFNTAIGNSALHTLTTGSSNTAIGYQADVSSGSLTNATAIGGGAVVNANNKVRIGSSLVTVIEGQVAWSYPSDRRLKEDILDLPLGLDFVKKLRPVQYRTRTDTRLSMGFIAQDIESLLGADYGVVTIAPDENHTLGMRYTDLIAPMVKAIQEQQKLIEQLQAEVERLKQNRE